MTLARTRADRLARHLDAIADALVQRIRALDRSLGEGTVMTCGPPPYRRIDGDGRALAYLRCRPRKLHVRVDVSGLWADAGPSPLRRTSASGVTLVVASGAEVEAAARYLVRAVAITRKQVQVAAGSR